VKRPLSQKVGLMFSVLVAGIVPLLATVPASPRSAPAAYVTSPFQSPDITAKAVALTSVPKAPRPAAPKPATTVSAPNPADALPRMSWADYVRAKSSVPYLVDPSVQTLIKKCYNTTQNVWLTFDDGYTSAENLSSILQTLSYFNVRGRFFLIGSWARQHPDMVNQIVTAGHYVENHTNNHAHLGQIGDADVSSQIEFGQGSNSSPKLLRPPYGDGMFTTRLYYLAGQQGYLLCGWGTDSLDYAGVSAAVIVNKVVHGDYMTPAAGPGQTVLMHLKNTQTRYALPILIPALKAEGLTFDKLR
jgi:peptidoglycan/xylan/chitin deacetylase (PgdA/CDA1 family)